MRITRHTVLAIAAVAVLSAGGPLGQALAGDPTSLSAYPPWPTPPNIARWCHQEWQCGPRGCGWQQTCPPQTFVSSYEWQVQNHDSPEALARYDDAWCRTYGPPGSREYLQCRENNYYTRLSVPNRMTR